MKEFIDYLKFTITVNLIVTLISVYVAVVVSTLAPNRWQTDAACLCFMCCFIINFYTYLKEVFEV